MPGRPGDEDRDGRILLGRIVAAHGVRGEVLVRSYADDPAAIGAYGPLAAPAANRTLELRVLRVTAKGVVARIAGIGDRNAAEALAGIDLYIDRVLSRRPDRARRRRPRWRGDRPRRGRSQFRCR